MILYVQIVYGITIVNGLIGHLGSIKKRAIMLPIALYFLPLLSYYLIFSVFFIRLLLDLLGSPGW